MTNSLTAAECKLKQPCEKKSCLNYLAREKFEFIDLRKSSLRRMSQKCKAIFNQWRNSRFRQNLIQLTVKHLPQG